MIRAIKSVQLAAEYISHLNGEQIPMSLNKASANRIAFTMREPVGVVFAICAFNHPLNLVIHQTATAIAAGCPVIIKPGKYNAVIVYHFAAILEEAGLPKVGARCWFVEMKWRNNCLSANKSISYPL